MAGIEVPAIPIDVSSIGPQIGHRFPDVTLPDQFGSLIDLHEHRSDGKALVVFIRSASW